MLHAARRYCQLVTRTSWPALQAACTLEPAAAQLLDGWYRRMQIGTATRPAAPLSLQAALRTVGRGLDTGQAREAQLHVSAAGILVESAQGEAARSYSWSEIAAQTMARQQLRRSGERRLVRSDAWALTHWSVLLRVTGALLDERGIATCAIAAAVHASTPSQDGESRVLVAQQEVIDTDAVRQHRDVLYQRMAEAQALTMRSAPPEMARRPAPNRDLEGERPRDAAPDATYEGLSDTQLAAATGLEPSVLRRYSDLFAAFLERRDGDHVAPWAPINIATLQIIDALSSAGYTVTEIRATLDGTQDEASRSLPEQPDAVDRLRDTLREQRTHGFGSGGRHPWWAFWRHEKP
jgi:DNA-binding transcriptional MerR regulator